MDAQMNARQLRTWLKGKSQLTLRPSRMCGAEDRPCAAHVLTASLRSRFRALIRRRPIPPDSGGPSTSRSEAEPGPDAVAEGVVGQSARSGKHPSGRPGLKSALSSRGRGNSIAGQWACASRLSSESTDRTSHIPQDCRPDPQYLLVRIGLLSRFECNRQFALTQYQGFQWADFCLLSRADQSSGTTRTRSKLR